MAPKREPGAAAAAAEASRLRCRQAAAHSAAALSGAATAPGRGDGACKISYSPSLHGRRSHVRYGPVVQDHQRVANADVHRIAVCPCYLFATDLFATDPQR